DPGGHAPPRSLLRTPGRWARRLLRRRGALARDAPRAAVDARARSYECREEIAFRMISAASPASAGFASSYGEWLTPSLQGTNTIAHGTWSATHIVSCAAPECMTMNGSRVSSAAAVSAPTMRSSSGVEGRVWRSLYSAVIPRLCAADS